ncbi:MAG TPA: D-alanyl-D-alanine carboxypeptidase/D-alanyl-D-alanine-endopeptidase [Ignavibacteriaceae bacterium]|nr:D-alanyl-D-alanine carboxypeptidase/D-alanyl-D-alanine-endopeptidase [Ignavibacteriaceae bacterium]
MKKLFILFILIYSISFSQSVIKTKLDSLTSTSFFDTTIIALDVYDLTADKVLYQKNNKLLLRPASNMKILTTVTGLYFLGKDYTFKTSLYYSGNIKNGTLNGNLYVKGGFDPDFTYDDLDSLILILKNNGIKKIKGNIYGDISAKDSLFWGHGWMWDDDPSTDAPYLSALNINDNAIEVTQEKNKVPQLTPKTSFVKVERAAIKDINYLDRKWLPRENTILYNGVILGNKPLETKLNVFTPEKYFLHLFCEKLVENKMYNKVKYNFSSSDYMKEIGKFERRYDTVIVNLNKTSDNLSAEMTLLALASLKTDKSASAKDGVIFIDSLIYLAGLNPENYSIVDGSGVSHYNLISSELLLGVLKFMYKNRPDLFNTLYNSFPIGGVDGTLRNRLKDSLVYNNVHAKTGTLSGVSSLSGYLTTLDNHIISFSIMMQNYTGTSQKVRNYQDEICKQLVEYGTK